MFSGTNYLIKQAAGWEGRTFQFILRVWLVGIWLAYNHMIICVCRSNTEPMQSILQINVACGKYHDDGNGEGCFNSHDVLSWNIFNFKHINLKNGMKVCNYIFFYHVYITYNQTWNDCIIGMLKKNWNLKITMQELKPWAIHYDDINFSFF